MRTEQTQGRTLPGAADTKSGLYALTGQDRFTIYAALRVLQEAPALIELVGATTALDKEGIDVLCKSITRPGMEFEQITPLFGHDERNRYVACARNLAREGELEVDIPALVCDGEEGAYVMAWLWVSRRDAGLDSADD